MSLIDSALVPQKLLEAGFTYREAAILYGQLTGKAFVLINIPLTISSALCASLMPIIAESYILNRKVDVINKVDLSFKISMVIAIPSTIGLYVLAHPILDLIFPGQSAGFDILQYSALSIPFIVLVQTSTAVLQGIGHYVRPVANLALGCIIKVVITLFLVPIPHINIYGAVLGSIGGYIATCILNIIFLSRKLKIRVNYFETMVKPAFASIFMMAAVVIIYLYVYNYSMNSRIACFLAVIAGVIIYVPIIVIFGIFKYSYIKRRFLKK